jgi:hypothetical protein
LSTVLLQSITKKEDAQREVQEHSNTSGYLKDTVIPASNGQAHIKVF